MLIEMKTLYLLTIIISALGILITANPVYAPCLVGVTDCGPPPGVTVSTWTDSQSYERNDTVNLKGKLYVENYTNPVQVQVVNPMGMAVQTLETFVTNNTFSAKINANFSENGMYQIVTCVKSWCDRSYFKYTGEPYALSFNGRNYPVWYKSIADVDNMSMNTSEDSLLIHLSSAPIGSIFQISLPRNLIDSASTNGADSNFTVFAGEDSVQKLMSKANFNETKTSQTASTLEIQIPSYSQIADMQGEMYVKIVGTKMSEISDMVILSPLQQFKSGTPASDVKCNDGLQLILKGEDGSPACVKPDAVQELVERGWASSLLVSTTNTLSKNICGQFYTAPNNQHGVRTTPVLLMGYNSTACVKLTFTIVSNYKDCNGQTCQNIIALGSTLHIGDLHYEKHDNMFSMSAGKDYTHSFIITTIPDAVDLANYSIGANFTVTYVIKPLTNATGFYDQSIPKLACESYPLAVGYAAGQVNASDFGYIDSLNPPCAAWVYTLTGVEISGLSYKDVTLP